MKAVVQRVRYASVEVEKELVAAIPQGLLVLLGVHQEDEEVDLEKIVKKVCSLRIFNDEEGKMNLDVNQVQGQILLVSQFTLLANSKKGNRPSYIDAARPEKALKFFELAKKRIEEKVDKEVLTGVFGADMQVSLLNDGPVTILLDSKEL